MVTSTDGSASSTTSINWIDTGTGALFDFDFAHTRPGTANSYAQSYESVLIFTVGTQDTTYAISGTYQAQAVGAPGGVVSYVYLQNVAGGGDLMSDFSESINTSNESFTLGISGDGDRGNSTQGTLTGTLQAGQTYRFFLNDYIYANSNSGGASATGCVTLSIGGATGAGSCGNLASVPDSGYSTASLLAVALVALAYAFHRA